MFKAKVTFTLAEIICMVYLGISGFIAECLESHNYLLLAISFLATAIVCYGITWIVSTIKRKLR